MRMRSSLALWIGMLVVLTCQAAVAQRDDTAQAAEISSKSNDCYERLTESMTRMHHAMMSVKPSGNADADFVRLMLPHHEAALDMAKVELQCGTDPQMRRLAQEIIADQQAEIQLMQLWLKQHQFGRPAATRAPQR